MMPRFFRFALPAIFAGLAAFTIWQQKNPDSTGNLQVSEVGPGSGADSPDPDLVEKKHAPSDYFFTARSWPDGVFSLEAYSKGLEQAREDYRNLKSTATMRGGGASWQLEGPTNIGGRINTIAVNPVDHNIIYVGCAAGGIFKTTDGGTTWTPIFDDQLFLPIGDIEIDPSNPDVIYAGTGDVNVSGYPFIGDGLYKSTDAGMTWTHLGLTETRIISRVRVHPMDPNLIYVGAMGLPFEKDSNRGLYKSEDGGVTWSQILYISDSTGVCDFLIDETNPDQVWAAGWDRLRNNFYSIVYGPGATIRRTTDGGDSWTTLGGGLPVGYQCRIGLDQEPGNPNHILAQVIGTDFESEGIYESVNGGNTWVPYDVSFLSGSSAMGGFGWYFAKVRFNPFAPGQVWVCGVNLWRTINQGASWINTTVLGDVHADKHDLVFLSETEALLATDGGLYRTINGGVSWSDADNIPNTQFYHVQINPHLTGEYWGGAQDNGTVRGSSAAPDFWQRAFGGDGFHTEFNPQDENIRLVETQNGDIWYSADGGIEYDWLSASLPFDDRRSWDMPYILSPHDPSRIYAGTYRMHRAEGPSPWFTPISEDLTRGPLTEPRFHVLSAIRESYVTEGLLYTGSSDGRINRSDDGAFSWDLIGTGLPNRYITDVECSFQNSDVLFITQSGYKDNDFTPMIHYSTDRGNTWTPIAGDLPQLGINRLEVYPGNDSMLFLANDGGIYFTTNLGADWNRLGTGMPVVNVYDLRLDTRLGKLVAGTHARSMMSIELADLIPSQLKPELSDDAVVCSGEPVLLEADGALLYSWSPSTGLSCTDCPNPLAAPSSTTTYTVTFSDGLGHEETRNVTVNISEAPPIPVISASTDTLFAGGTSGVFQWYVDGLPIAGATSSFYVPSIAGSYAVQVTDPGGCSSTSAELIWMPVGLEPTWAKTWIYGPNPLTDMLVLQLPPLNGHSTYRVRCYDAQGNLLREVRASGGTARESIAAWAPGLYYLRVDAQGISRTVKLVKM